MKSEDYASGDTFQLEKRTVFSTEWLPLCADAQVARPGDFMAASVGGWSIFGVRDGAGALRVIRNACRHQNMQVVGTPSGNCESFRCRYHGWTYDLQGRFLSAPAPVAPKDPQSADLNLAQLSTAVASGLVFFSLGNPAGLPDLGGSFPAHGGTFVTEIACNWKVCVEHLLGAQPSSPDFAWHWPLVAVRRAGGGVLVEQVVPHTFLRTRLVTHVFGGAAADHGPAAETIKRACERLQLDRNEGRLAPVGSELLADFHRRLDQAYALDPVST